MYYSAHQTRYKLEESGPSGIEQLCPFNACGLWRGSHEELPWKRRALLRSWVQIPPGPFLSTRELRYWFEPVLGSCGTECSDTVGLSIRTKKRKKKSDCLTAIQRRVCVLLCFLLSFFFMFCYCSMS
jgi:hypothetical protein